MANGNNVGLVAISINSLKMDDLCDDHLQKKLMRMLS
jgi:hypothetical protein